MVGRIIVAVRLTLPKLFRPEPGLDTGNLEGKTIQSLRRRAKLLVWELSGDLALVVHLKLTGQVVHLAADGSELAHGGHPVPGWGQPLPHKATHLRIDLDDGSRLYLTDIRQFARLWLMHADDVPAFLDKQGFGPEPLTDDFKLAPFRAALARRGVPIKSVLLDQSVIGGVGNIYADESLWAARIHPSRPAQQLTAPEVKRLFESIRSVLDYAVREGVAFVLQGKAISDRDFPYAHGRAGEPCGRCGAVIRKAWINGRGSYWCPKCQPGRGLRGGRVGAHAAAARVRSPRRA